MFLTVGPAAYFKETSVFLRKLVLEYGSKKIPLGPSYNASGY